MKNSFRLISAILAAVLCGFSLAACANNPEPLITNITADTTTTIAPITDTPAVTTDTPVMDTAALTTEVQVISEDFEYVIELDGNVTITKYTGNDEHVAIPEYIEGREVTKIGEDAFSKKVTITGAQNTVSLGMPDYKEYVAIEGSSFPRFVTIPSTVTVIGARAFMGCSFLEKIVIPDSVIRIDDYAFAACLSLREIKLSDSLTYIGSAAFAFCESLQAIDIPNTVSFIGSEAFRQSKLTEIALPDSVTELGAYAFSHCNELQTVTLSRNIKTISEFTFEKCYNLSNVTIPYGVEIIEKYAFVYCTAYKIIDLPDSITHIYTAAFCGCSPNTVTLSENLLYLAKYNFNASDYCLLENNVYYLGSSENPYFCIVKLETYGDYSSFEKIPHGTFTLNNKTVIIAPYAIEGCDLEGLILPNSLCSIMANAISISDREFKVSIPSGVKYICKNSITGSVELFFENEVTAYSAYREDYYDAKYYHGPIK